VPGRRGMSFEEGGWVTGSTSRRRSTAGRMNDLRPCPLRHGRPRTAPASRDESAITRPPAAWCSVGPEANARDHRARIDDALEEREHRASNPGLLTSLET